MAMSFMGMAPGGLPDQVDLPVSLRSSKNSRPDGRIPCPCEKNSLPRQKKFPAPTPVGICESAHTARGLRHNLAQAIAALTGKWKKFAAKFPASRESADQA
jgi:hypothetical protein